MAEFDGIESSARDKLILLLDNFLLDLKYTGRNFDLTGMNVTNGSKRESVLTPYPTVLPKTERQHHCRRFETPMG